MEKTYYLSAIVNIDRKISYYRERWLKAKGQMRVGFMDCIDCLLDYRISMMKLRDQCV